MNEPGPQAHGVDVAVRFYRKGDDEEILDLLTTSFGRWPSVEIPVLPIDHLRWKMSSHPLASQLHTIGEVDSKPVGVWLITLHQFKVRDRVLLCRCGADACVHPDYQSAGIMSAMRERTLADFSRLVDLRLGGQTSNREMLSLVLRGPYEVVANRVEVFNCPLTALAPISDDHAWTIQPTALFDQRLDAFWEEASRPFDFIGLRDARYLNWRYEPRAGKFTLLQAEHDGTLLGYTVLRVLRGRGNVADLLVLPGRLDVARALLHEGLRRFSAEGLDVARCWLPGRHPYRAVLESEGFTSEKLRKPPFMVGPLGMPADGLTFLSDPDAAVHIMIGDSEVF